MTVTVTTGDDTPVVEPAPVASVQAEAAVEIAAIDAERAAHADDTAVAIAEIQADANQGVEQWVSDQLTPLRENLASVAGRVDQLQGAIDAMATQQAEMAAQLLTLSTPPPPSAEPPAPATATETPVAPAAEMPAPERRGPRRLAWA